MPSSHQNQARSPAFHSIRSSAFHRISHQPGWLTSCNTGLKVISAHRNSPANRASPAHIIRPLVDQKNGDWMIKQSLNSVIAKHCDLSVSRRSIICLSFRLRQIIDQLATDKSRYFAQPRSIIVNWCCERTKNINNNEPDVTSCATYGLAWELCRLQTS